MTLAMPTYRFTVNSYTRNGTPSFPGGYEFYGCESEVLSIHDDYIGDMAGESIDIDLCPLNTWETVNYGTPVATCTDANDCGTCSITGGTKPTRDTLRQNDEPDCRVCGVSTLDYLTGKIGVFTVLFNGTPECTYDLTWEATLSFVHESAWPGNINANIVTPGGVGTIGATITDLGPFASDELAVEAILNAVNGTYEETTPNYYGMTYTVSVTVARIA
jgi:hypothetical protein